jgi:hypothetical protein
MASVGSTLPGETLRDGSKSLYSERAFLSQIISFSGTVLKNLHIVLP